jgi:hypothetical protein
VVNPAYVDVAFTESRTNQVPVDVGVKRAVTAPLALVVRVARVVTDPLVPLRACTSTVRTAAGFTVTERLSSPPSFIVAEAVLQPESVVATACGAITAPDAGDADQVSVTARAAETTDAASRRPVTCDPPRVWKPPEDRRRR